MSEPEKVKLPPEYYQWESYINALKEQVIGLQEYVLAFQAIAMQATGKKRSTLEHEAQQIIHYVRDQRAAEAAKEKSNPDGGDVTN